MTTVTHVQKIEIGIRYDNDSFDSHRVMEYIMEIEKLLSQKKIENTVTTSNHKIHDW